MYLNFFKKLKQTRSASREVLNSNPKPTIKQTDIDCTGTQDLYPVPVIFINESIPMRWVFFKRITIAEL